MARLVVRRLRALGYRVTATQEPTLTPLGRAVRKAIRNGGDPLALAFLFLADRAEHGRALARDGKGARLVVTDRYADSTTAYQGAALAGRGFDALATLDRLQKRLFPIPQVVFLLDIDPRLALKRIRGRAVKEPFERVRFLDVVRKNYLTLARRGGRRWRVLDARRPAEELANEAVAVLALRRR